MIDKMGFVTLIDQKSEMLYRVARTILRNDEDCKDALQDAVLKAWAKRSQLKDSAMAGTWLTRILINECHTLLRKGRKYILQEEIAQSAGPAAPNQELQWALEKLPEKLRLPLVLHYLEGYTYEQLGQILRLPQSTVRSRLVQARKALRMEMEDEKEAWLHES